MNPTFLWLSHLPHSFFVTILCTISFLTQTHSYSLSSVSISYTSNNQTLICALIPSSKNPQTNSFINCTTFPTGLQFSTHFNNVSYSRIVGGMGFLCGIRSQPRLSIMECWRFSENGGNLIRKRLYKGPVLSDIEAGNSHVCGVSNDNSTLTCWLWREWESISGSNSHSLSNAGISSKIAVGENFVCGLTKNNGNVFCIGNENNVTKNQPSGNFSVISAGSNHACAISLDMTLQCWGIMEGTIKPQGKFIDLALGKTRNCAMRANGTVICWGSDGFVMPTRLQETSFIGILAKGSIFCGVVTSNFSLVCWGDGISEKEMLVFSKVMPGVCTSECSSSCPLPGYDEFCGQGLMICMPCEQSFGSPNVSALAPPPGGGGNVPPRKKGSITWTAKMVVFLVVGCLGSLALVLIIVFLLCRYCRGKGCRVHDSGPLELAANAQGNDNQGTRQESDEQSVVVSALEKRLSHMYSIGKGGNLEEFPIEVLKEVTKNFSLECRIGIGSFGVVYYATLEDGREVAIKRAEVSTTLRAGIRRHQEDKDIAFMAELEFLSRLNHKHLVRLIGFYEDANERILVYEFMNNLTLHDHIHKLKDASPLASWAARIKVALDAARGVEYLHAYAVPPIIHRDIKPSNILLDSNWTAKVSDFGLSLMGPPEGESYLSLRAAGTFGYVDPEYYRLHQLTTKSDVYSFGVVLLELLSGYKAIHTIEDDTPRNVVDFLVPYITRGDIHRLLDPNVPPPTPVEIEVVMFVGDLAVECVSAEGRNRPSMSEVVGCLERALAACLARPALSSSSTASSR